MAEPGLLPIIPPFPAQRGPSPLIPVIVLFIVGTLRWAVLQALEFWESFASDPYDWSETIESIQSHFFITALLAPLCLLLAIQAFGIPQVNPVRNAPPPSPFVKAITQNVWSSILLVVVIFALLLSVPIRNVIHSPWKPDDISYAQPVPVRGRKNTQNGVCEEIAILQMRCENWKGNARGSVCRDLAQLKKRCEKSQF